MVAGEEWVVSIRSPGAGSLDLLVSVFNFPVYGHRGDGDAENKRIYTGGPSEPRGIVAEGADGQQLQSLMLVLSQVIYNLLWQIVGFAIFAIEQDQNSKISCTRLCWYDDIHGVDTVPVVRVDPSVVDDNAIVEDPQIQQQGHLSSSSVMDIQYLQLRTPLPRLQKPDRLLGEPPAGHQLVCSMKAFEDCSCGTFGSGLSTDGRSPFGSSYSLRCRNHVLLLSLSGLCHISDLYLALFFRAMMYFVS